ncbi:MAG TPA: hypothetical protein PLU58_05455 [Saprospiraceae bacterium]|nr:hypothetical protein [Saprospiraceae bacterium]
MATRLTEMVTWRPPIFVPVPATDVKHFVAGQGGSRKSFKE